MTNDVIDIMVQLFVVYILCISLKDSCSGKFCRTSTNRNPNFQVTKLVSHAWDSRVKEEKTVEHYLLYDIFVNPTLIRITQFK